MTIKDRKINVYLNRLKRFNELCPKNGFYWGGLPITPITDRNIKSKLREMEEDEIGRKLQWLERGIKLLEETDLLLVLCSQEKPLQRGVFLPFLLFLFLQDTF